MNIFFVIQMFLPVLCALRAQLFTHFNSNSAPQLSFDEPQIFFVPPVDQLHFASYFFLPTHKSAHIGIEMILRLPDPCAENLPNGDDDSAPQYKNFDETHDRV
ncbi:MAG: hypothetical protein E7047_03815 [Lentisphaerae bacterium]|nr:hypothetical protein [Lentisphaerota bacterium]